MDLNGCRWIRMDFGGVARISKDLVVFGSIRTDLNGSERSSIDFVGFGRIRTDLNGSSQL